MTDLILGGRGPFAPQAPDDLTLTLGALPGGVGYPATFGATIRFGAAFLVTPPPTGGIAATIRFRAAIAVTYDLGIPDLTGTEGGGAWQAATPLRAGTIAPWSPSDALSTDKPFPWRSGDRVLSLTRLPWHSGDRVLSTTRLPWHSGAPVRPPGTRFPWQHGLAMRFDRRLPWQDGERSDRTRRLPWSQHVVTLLRVRLPWQDGLLIETDGGNPWILTPEPPFVAPVDLRFCRPYVRQPSDALELILGADWCGPGVPAGVIIPYRKVYIVINDTHLIKLDGMIDMPTLGMQLTIDAGSWTWGFSATLPADQLPLVAPDTDGTPVLVAAVINGVSYYMIVESIQRSRSFGVATITIAGRGKNALLDTPYAVTQSFSNGTSRTAAQLLDDALTLNGVSIGWSIDFGLTDWLVPAGAWSVTGSHIAAALTVAGAAGGYIQPHATDDTLRVLARYPSAPWDWDLVAPDFELPSSVTTQEGIAWVEKARYNRVFVSGQGAGVLGRVTRSGTAGDVAAPMVTDPLITAAAAARQRGINILADTGRIATVTLRLPVLYETGIITPGMFVRYNDAGVYRMGIVRSTAVEVSSPEVWQTIGVETHE